jgi:uncharacterized paraquat-inducible protein A
VTTASCARCGALFPVATELTGGIANCPQCGRTVEVPGLRDGAWRLLQVAAALVVVVVVVVSYRLGGWQPALLAGALAAGMVWLLSRAL